MSMSMSMSMIQQQQHQQRRQHDNNNHSINNKRNNNNNNNNKNYKLKLLFLILVLFCTYNIIFSLYSISSDSSSSSYYGDPSSRSSSYWSSPSLSSSSSSSLLYDKIQYIDTDDDKNADTDTDDADASPRRPTGTTRRKRTKIIHVMNAYTIPNNINNSNSNNNNTNTNKKMRASRIQPFDQWSTIKSIERAMKHVEEFNKQTNVDNNNNNNIVDVDFICAIFESDLPYLKNENLPCHITILKRSTKTEYYKDTNDVTNDTNDANDTNDNVYNYYKNFLGDSPKELPFIQDIIDSAITDYYTREEIKAAKIARIATANNIDTDTGTGTGTGTDTYIDEYDVNDFYVMCTNSDIGLTKDFYSHLLPKLDNKEAISINRITIKTTNEIENISNQYYYNNYNNNNNDNDNDNNDNNISNNNNNNLISDMLLNEIDNTIQNGKGIVHQGYDCFIVHSNVLNRINTGDMFAGYLPWGGMYHSILMIMAKNYINYKANPQFLSLDDGSKYYGGSTYHIGDERKWNKVKNIKNSEFDILKKYVYYDYNYIGLKNCGPLKRLGPYATLNKLNSCILWLPRNNTNTNTNTNTNNNHTNTNTNTNTSINNNRNNTSTTNIIRRIIPNFVQPGYEEFYINQINSRNLCLNKEKTRAMFDFHFKRICPPQSSVNNNGATPSRMARA